VSDDITMFAGVSTPTLTTVLLKKGLRNVWIRGARPLGGASPRIVGRAFTLNFIPAREDMAMPEAWASPISTRAALEAAPEGAIVVANAMGLTDAGVFGDILCARMVKRGLSGLVTDGVVRDIAGVRATGLPVWAQGAASPPSVAGLIFTGWEQPIGCGGVAVFPGDVIVADADGAVVVPTRIAAEIAELAREQERLEAWILSEVERGVRLPGLYPPNAEAKARYEKTRRPD
jgi:regulator of RNase E activity RraA